VDVYSGRIISLPCPLSGTRRHWREGGSPLPPSKGAFLAEETILETRSVTKRFDGFAAVSGVNYRSGRGVGGDHRANGAGKTTFFNLLTGMFPPTEGTVLYRGPTSHGFRSRKGAPRDRTDFQLVSCSTA